ncbi:serine hydrolase domain-containing protein [Algoriphagus boritolerans]|uniref:serine hydrolase domain-containing protein n=1 Tax=Algoriphagus boritolerans TaxID=308111 RepID=UPI000A7F0DD4
MTYLKAFGYQNLKTKDSLTLQSLIPVASVSKLFTALTLANYAVEKGISIDTSFNSILPGNQRLSSDFEHISLADLLNHTSGLTDQSSIRTLFFQVEKTENSATCLNS